MNRNVCHEFEIVLPSEAQWEYACRAKRDTPFTFAEGEDGTTCHPRLCNFAGNQPFPYYAAKDKNTKRRYRGRTIPVDGLASDGKKIDAIGPNRWGFCQMHGNAWELCRDWFAAEFYRSATGKGPDPVNETRASSRVLRGGGWGNCGLYCRSAYRNGHWPSARDRDIGFRLAAVLEPRQASKNK